jgi:hypothetical protein
MNPVPPNTVMQPVITCPLAIGLEQDARAIGQRAYRPTMFSPAICS